VQSRVSLAGEVQKEVILRGEEVQVVGVEVQCFIAGRGGGGGRGCRFNCVGRSWGVLTLGSLGSWLLILPTASKRCQHMYLHSTYTAAG
jgi:hypothetical protein